MTRKILYLITFCLLALGCNEEEFLEEDVKDSITAENLFVDYSGFYSGMNSVYANMRLIKGAGASMSRDQVWVVNTDVVSSRSDGVFNYSELGVTYDEFEDVFEWCYAIINTTNLIINRAEGDDIDWEAISAEQAEGNKNTIIAEARVARAWAYRLLIYAFGPVPLSVDEVTGANFTNAWSRNPIEEIKMQMQEDLEFATVGNRLPLAGGDDTRINRAVAIHYLGELYLSMGEFQMAVDVLRTLCESDQYTLVQSRFGRVANNPDGNYFMDMIRNPYSSSGNTETFFVMANGLELPGGEKISLNDSYINEFRKYSKIEETEEWYIRFGGFGKGRYVMTPWSMFNEEDYDTYLRNVDGDNTIGDWIWNNTDGRTNYLYEMDDIRGQNESLRRYFVHDWNDNGTLTDPSTFPLDETLFNNDATFNDQDNDGDTLYTHFLFDPAGGAFSTANKYAYHYSRKWEIDDTQTVDFTQRETAYPDVGYLRIAETYLLYAEALMMNGNTGEAAVWINRVRDRAQASPVTGADITLDFILDERARELVSEEERKITLLRTGKYLERTKLYNVLSMPFVQDHHKLWPLPDKAIISNKDNPLEQNLGYGGSVTVDFTPPGYPDEGVNP